MPFRDLSIRRKLLLMSLAASTAALVLASAGFLAWDTVQFRREITADVQAQARILGDNSAAALTFADEQTAGETLSALQLRPHVVVGCLYTNAGRLFATYLRDDERLCPPSPPARAQFGWERYDVIIPVRLREERVGTLYIDRDLADVFNRLQVGIGTVLGLLAIAIVTAFLIAARMQRTIAAPLLHLAETARAISTTRDYRLRATQSSNDEVGVVVRAFNDMLDRIGERTAELSKANTDLEREVEERRRAEQARTQALEREQTANRLKDEFLATLSHELRTPLNAMLGWTRVLRSTKVEPATEARALESIERNARAQARLVEDLLEISRIVTGKLRLQVRSVDLASIVDSALEVVQPAAAAKRLQLAVEITARPAMTTGDPDRLQQVVWNVLSNAVKFTPADGRVSVVLEHNAGYRLTVSDTGPGIDPKFLPYVFEAFRQADGSVSREHGGLGLGLAIAKQLVELHGGTIQAHSPGRGAGATFVVDLPSVVTAIDQPRVAVETAPPSPVDAALLRGIHVLVVDDEEDARSLLEAALGEYGADVVSAGSVAEAMASINDRMPDVLVSDIGMPHQDGFALIRALRSGGTAAGGSLVPAIAVTAYASQKDRDEALAAGFQAHVSKPFEPAAVAHLIARFARSEA
jgi:signal transduction histidine kinase/ActR/RegA family two-component response regulator